jgi:hypothetical protein
VAVALALAGTDADSRGTLPLSAQAVYDRGLALGLMVTALIFGLAGEIGRSSCSPRPAWAPWS